MAKGTLFIVLVAVFATACGGNVRPTTLDSIPPKTIMTEEEERQYRIGAADVLTVLTGAGDPTTAFDVTVRVDGYVTLPKLGDVKVEDLTVAEASKAIEKALRATGANSDVWLAVKETSLEIYIVGEVKTPGAFPIKRPITVGQALALAGGFAEWAKTGRIIIARDVGAERWAFYRFNYKDVTKGKQKRNSKNVVSVGFKLRGGDILVVP